MTTFQVKSGRFPRHPSQAMAASMPIPKKRSKDNPSKVLTAISRGQHKTVRIRSFAMRTLHLEQVAKNNSFCKFTSSLNCI